MVPSKTSCESHMTLVADSWAVTSFRSALTFTSIIHKMIHKMIIHRMIRTYNKIE